MAERLWIMVDLETSGPIFGRHSLLEVGAAVGSKERGLIDTFEAIIRPVGDEVVASHDSWRRAMVEGVAPVEAMQRFDTWTKPYREQSARFVARPAAFDWPWIVYYAWSYLGENPFGFSATCATSWFHSRRKRFQVELPHVAVQDAVIQLELFLTEV